MSPNTEYPMFAIANCDSTFSIIVLAVVVFWLLMKVYRTIDDDGSIATAIKDAIIRVVSKVG